MANGKRVGLRYIVAEDRTKIVEHKEGRSPRSLRRKQRGLVGGPRERLAVHPDNADLLPLAERLQRVLADPLRIEALGQFDFVAPGFAGAPIRNLEIARRRSKSIGNVVPD